MMTPSRARAISRRARLASIACYALSTITMALTYGCGLWQLSSFALVLLGLRYTIDANASWWWARGYKDAQRDQGGQVWFRILDDPEPPADGDDPSR